MQRIHCIVPVACLCLATLLHAQTVADTTHFRAGQWGVEFIPSQNMAEGGVLRFGSPTQALVFDGGAAYNQQTQSGSGVFGTGQSGRSLSFNARVGSRWYQPQYERAVSFLGLGVTGGYSTNSQSYQTSSNSEEWSAGVYGELGLQYLFTPHLGLGVRGNLVASRDVDHVTEQASGATDTARTTNYSVRLAPVQVIAAFYF